MGRKLYDLRSHESLLRKVAHGDDSDNEQFEILQRLRDRDAAFKLLAEIAALAEALNEHIAVHGTGACNGVRSRVQAIHGLAVTPEVEEWGAA